MSERKGRNKRRMKAGAEKHQLRTTAAGEPDRVWRERRELEEGKDRKNPHWRNGGVGKKLKGALLRLADKERHGDGEGGEQGTEISMHLDR